MALSGHQQRHSLICEAGSEYSASQDWTAVQVVSSFGSLDDSKNWLKVLESITFEDVVKVGKLIFDEQKSTVLLFYPQKLKEDKL